VRPIIPHLWFDREAIEAAQFYVSLFPNSAVTSVYTMRNVPAPGGDSDIVSFHLAGRPFMSISAGPVFRFNPSISFLVRFNAHSDQHAATKLKAAWASLATSGKVLMELAEYDFSKLYGWVEDKYGLSWQLMLVESEARASLAIDPALLFVGPVYGKAEEATNYYIAHFPESKRTGLARYGAGLGLEREGTMMFSDITLCGQDFVAMDSGYEHAFAFNEAVSLLIPCETQAEIDYHWSRLSAVPEAEMCGWLKDAYGVSWQVWPVWLGEVLATGKPEQVERVIKSLLKMKKFDLAVLEQAFAGL